jgi:pyruvate formate lyase activating enzyme
MIFGGWQKFSLIDFPGRASAILFTQGCPFRCPFCHNPELINPTQGMFAPVTEEEILDFLATRQKKLDGVVITGGEPTLQKDLLEFVAKIKSLGFAIKLDTNGSRPEIIEKLIMNGHLDYVAMDYKAPLEKYQMHSGSMIDVLKIKESVELIRGSGVDYEFRTTVVKELLDFEDILKIAEELKGAKRFVLQKFLPGKTLDPLFAEMTTYTDEEFEKICKKIKKFVAQCLWR